MKELAVKILIPCIIYGLVAVFGGLMIVQMKHNCAGKHASIDKLILNNDKFKSPEGRIIAERIYAYRSMYAYSNEPTDDFIKLFVLGHPDLPPDASKLSDIALYRLVSCHESQFSVLVVYIPIFNNAKYYQCISEFDAKTNTFTDSTLDTITRDLIGIGGTRDLSTSIDDYLNKMNPNHDADITALFKNILTGGDNAKLYSLLTNGYMA